jgi:tRNA (guanine-N7-)-methyltransferase
MMVIFNPEKKQKVNLKKSFANQNQVFALEIGAGKGQFSFHQALKHPEINFVAMEKEATVVGVALRKVIETSRQKGYVVKNLKFFNNFAENLTTFFEPESFAIIYLNFSDP